MEGCARTLVVMARWPVSGRCKSRLAAELGPARAAAIQRRLTGHTLAVARQARVRLPFELVLAGSGLGGRALRRWGASLGCDRVVSQGRGGLGLRLQRQVGGAMRRGARRLVVVGSDLPELRSRDLEQAFAALDQHELVLGPAQDGGYWLIGLRRSRPGLFCGMGWGSDRVLLQTERAAAGLGLAAHRLAWRSDLDRPADLARWH
jgi:rSAM/selenodomain-associated transferase 1